MEWQFSLIFNFRFVVMSDEEGFSGDDQMTDVNTSVVQAKLLKDKINEILIGDEQNRNDDELMGEDQDVDEETESEENMNGAVASDTMTEEGSDGSDESEHGSNVKKRAKAGKRTRSRRNASKKSKLEKVTGKKRKRDKNYAKEMDTNPRKKQRVEDQVMTPSLQVSG